jgi:hypothetical protein
VATSETSCDIPSWPRGSSAGGATRREAIAVLGDAKTLELALRAAGLGPELLPGAPKGDPAP